MSDDVGFFQGVGSEEREEFFFLSFFLSLQARAGRFFV
jgi:hypothetical protein